MKTGWKNELEEALLKISVGRSGKDWVDEPVDAIMEEISPVIESLLKKQREKYYYEIENSTGTKEADYIDKQVNGGSE